MHTRTLHTDLPSTVQDACAAQTTTGDVQAAGMERLGCDAEDVGMHTGGNGLYRMDFVAIMVLAESKKLAFTKDLFGKGNLEGMVSEYSTSALLKAFRPCWSSIFFK